MAQVNAVILPAKALKGGRHKVRISVAHNGETRYINTDIVIDSESEFKNGAIRKRADASYLNTKLRAKLNEVSRAIDDIQYINGLTCSELVNFVKNGDEKVIDLESLLRDYLATSTARASSKTMYRYYANKIFEFIPPSTRLCDITSATVQRLKVGLLRDNIEGSARYKINLLKSMLKHAVNCGYVTYDRDIFASCKLTCCQPRQSWLSVEDVRTIRDLDLAQRGTQRVRDLFMLSYYLGGINMADIMRIDFREVGRTLKYCRKKTERRPKANKFVEFDVPREARELIARLADSEGRIICNNEALRFRLAKITKMTGFESMTFYSARKSFAQHAFNLGINESVIEYILGHSLGNSKSCLYSYIKVTPEMATDAIRRVIDNLNAG